MGFEKLMYFFENTRIGKSIFVLIVICVLLVMAVIGFCVFVWDHLIKDLITDEA